MCDTNTWNTTYDLGTVRSTNFPSSLSFTVAFMGTPSTAAPFSRASKRTLSTSFLVTSGRAASWIATTEQLHKQESAKESVYAIAENIPGAYLSGTFCTPLNTESCRSAPGSAHTILGSFSTILAYSSR